MTRASAPLLVVRGRAREARAPAGAAILLALAGCGSARVDVAAAPGFAAAAADLEAFIAHEMRDKELPALSIAVVRGGDVVWARGFGLADPDRSTPARADTVYRVGSISKVFTAVAAMQLVERGLLDLDAPVARYLPELALGAPGAPVTLRHLLAHHAGLVREPPVGSYFDPTAPTLAATVASLATTDLVYPPGSRPKYSNAGAAVVGRVVEVVSGEPFADYVRRHVVEPLGLARTSFTGEARLRGHLARGEMWTYDGRSFAAPVFDLGIAPAANLYSTAIDLARFAGTWCADGGAGTVLLTAESREAMVAPQFGMPADGGLGLGCFVDRLDGHRRLRHDGATYGFATELMALPDDGCAVAVSTSVDFASAVPERVATRALRWLLAQHGGRTPSAAAVSEALGREAARAREGVWEGDGYRVRTFEQDGELIAVPPSGVRVVLRGDGERLTADGRIEHGDTWSFEGDELRWRGLRLQRARDVAPPPPPAAWEPLIGEYGFDHDVLYVLERDGELCLLIEWFALYPLIAEDTDRFRLPDHGWYAGEPVVFGRDASGAVTDVTVGAVRFARRPVAESGSTFRIQPRLPEDVLRERAAAADPPQEEGAFRRPDLVDPTALDASIRLDLRYATTNNFMGMVFYRQPHALLQRPAAEALARAHRRLADHGYGILIHDAYRPWFVTKMFWDATPDEMRMFVADPAHGSRHNRGCAVDVTLYDLQTSRAVEMVSGYDEFTPRAFPDYPGGTSRQRWLRALLRRAMEAEGFTVYEHEWWHFDHEDWRAYPILNVPFR